MFFGKVVDQHDLPVVGARVTYTVHHLNFHGNPPIEGPLTDNNGRFEIRTHGPSITVSVSHPQFYQGKDAERQIDYSDTTTAHRFSPKSSGESPTLFKLVRKGEAETVIHVPSKEIRLPLDARRCQQSERVTQPSRHDQCTRGGEGREDQPFGQQLSHKPLPARAKRRTNSDFFLSSARTRH